MKHPQLDHIYHADHFGVLAPAVLKDWFDNVVDAVVTDPPYELDLMGKAWDSSGIAFSVDFWRDVLRVLKPGGRLLLTTEYHETQSKDYSEDDGSYYRVYNRQTWNNLLLPYKVIHQEVSELPHEHWFTTAFACVVKE